MDCPLEQNDDGSWTCPRCGWTHPTQVRRNCPGPRSEQETPAAAELVNAIWELASNNESTRCVFETGRCLARCQYCERFTGRGCLTFDGRDDRPSLLDVLTDRGRWCPRWGVGSG